MRLITNRSDSAYGLRRLSSRRPALIACAMPSRSMSWRMITKREPFSNGAPPCSRTTTRGLAKWP